MTPKKWPNTNLGWHRYYVTRFNEYQDPEAGVMADVYLLYHLAFGDSPVQA